MLIYHTLACLVQEKRARKKASKQSARDAKEESVLAQQVALAERLHAEEEARRKRDVAIAAAARSRAEAERI